MKQILIYIALVIAPVALAQSNRRTVVLSDLHLGVGHVGGKWHAFEDFRWTAELRAFLTFLTGQATDLVLNGDTFELWQSTERDCRHENPDYGCTAPEARARLVRVLAAHAEDLVLLRNFANTGDNHVFIVPGNHDAALLFADVAAAAISAIGARQDRVTVLKAGAFVSPDRAIVAFHGHQQDDANRYDTWPTPFLTASGSTYLQRPWGEQFVQEFYNRYEEKYPVIDNMSEAEGAWYGIWAEGLSGDVRGGTHFARFLRESISKRQQRQFLGAQQEHGEQWNLTAIRERGPLFFADALPEDDIAKPNIVAAANAGLLTAAFRELSEDDLIALCDQRSLLQAHGVQVNRCPPATLGRVAKEIPRAPYAELRAYLTTITDPKRPPLVAIVSHTHEASDTISRDPRTGRRLRIINTGAWQRTMRSFAAWRQSKQLTLATALVNVQPEDLPACYSYVIIPPYTKTPQAQLRFWTQRNGRWRSTDEPCP